MISLNVKINPAPRRDPPPERGFGSSRRLRRLLIWLGMLCCFGIGLFLGGILFGR